MYTLHTPFCKFGTDLYAQSVLISKISASELSRKFIGTALLVGSHDTLVRACHKVGHGPKKVENRCVDAWAASGGILSKQNALLHASKKKKKVSTHTERDFFGPATSYT